MTEPTRFPIRFTTPAPDARNHLQVCDDHGSAVVAAPADLIAALEQNERLRREVLVAIHAPVVESIARYLETGQFEWATHGEPECAAAVRERFGGQRSDDTLGEVDQLRRVVANLEERAEQAERRADAADRAAARDAAHHISRRVSVNFLDGCDPLSAESVALAVDRQHRAWVDLSNKLAAIRRTLDE